MLVINDDNLQLNFDGVLTEVVIRMRVLTRGVAFLFLRTGNGTSIFISYKRERDRDVVTLLYSMTRKMLNALPVFENGNASPFLVSGNGIWICFPRNRIRDINSRSVPKERSGTLTPLVLTFPPSLLHAQILTKQNLTIEK
jgi:hypothetical protein